MIDVILVDDQKLVREGIKMLLSLDDEVEVIGEAENGEKLLEIMSIKIPQVILMDIRMPVMDGVEATRLVKKNTLVSRLSY